MSVFTPIKIKIAPPVNKAILGFIKCTLSPIFTPINENKNVAINIANIAITCCIIVHIILKLIPTMKASMLVANDSKIMTLRLETSKIFSFNLKFRPSIIILSPIINNKANAIQ